MDHHYIDRRTGAAVRETFRADRSVGLLYDRLRESAPALFRALTGRRACALLGHLGYDRIPGRRGIPLFQHMGIDWRECLHPADTFVSPRQVFERQIRYWDCRPMEENPDTVVAPADSRLLCGELAETPALFVKEKFFTTGELLGPGSSWAELFNRGSYAVFRLTPDKYHYNHAPVAGTVVDLYTLDGSYHSCNPRAVLALASLHARNRRVVTVIDTDLPGGTGVGLVAMIEVVALMIGDIVQCVSTHHYDHPRPLARSMRLAKGAPKSLFRPGSSTVILLFQQGAVRFSDDLVHNLARVDVPSRFSAGLGRPLVETEVRVRETIARRKPLGPAPPPAAPPAPGPSSMEDT